MKNTPERPSGRCLARHALAALLIVAPLAQESRAQVPREIETQARLVDGQGDEITGPIQITVLIYDVPTGGTARWCHTFNTTAQGGVVNLRLGRLSETRFPDDLFDTGPLYITFKIGGKVGGEPEMMPRRELASAPFAVRADCVSNVDSTTAFEEGVVESMDIMDDGVESCDVKDGTIESCDVKNETIESCDVKDETVASCDIMDGTLASCDIKDGDIANADLAAESVDTGTICDGTITSVDLAPGSVGTTALQAGAVLPGNIGGGGGQQAGYVLTWNGGATWAPSVSPNTISSAEIIDGSILSIDLAVGAVDSSRIMNGTISSMDMGPMSVNSTALFDGAVTTSKIDTTPAFDGGILKYDAILGLQWGEDGFSVPHERIEMIGMPLLRLENTGGGEGIVGRSSSTAVRGELTYDGGPITFGTVDGGLGDRGSTRTHSSASFVAGATGEVSFADHGSDRAFGVYGAANVGPAGNTGFSAGVYGESYFQSGFSDSSLPSFGVCGSADGDESVGTLGIGNHEGVRGQLENAPGLLGSDTFGSLGLHESGSNDSSGVQGTSIGTGTTNYGVHGSAVLETSGLSAYGVYGEVDKGVGGMQEDLYGVYGKLLAGQGYGVFSDGDFGGTGAKYFVQPHPSDASKEVRFVCLEGNESGTYFRGTQRVDGGGAVIEVPEEFRLVSEEDGLTVQLTPIGAPATLWVHSQGLDRIFVRSDIDCEFHYFVNGVRRGHTDFQAVRENQAYRPRVRGVPYGAQYTEGQRRILVENGILNADFTPNETTAARLGWQLRDADEAEGGAR